MASYQETLRKIALRDESIVQHMQSDHPPTAETARLDSRACGLVRIAALVTSGGSQPSYRQAAQLALLGGATETEIVAVLIAVAQTVGVDRSVMEAPKLGLALGYDVDAALERDEDV
jgi:hypothetical protein